MEMKPFNLNEIIKNRVDREAEVAHAFDPIPPAPKYRKVEKIEKHNPGWTNFFKSTVETLKELRP